MKRIRTIIQGLLLGMMAVAVGCSDSRTPQLPEGQAWAPDISRTATGGNNLLVVLENGGNIQTGQLQPATTEGGKATWVGQGLTWPAGGAVELITFCPYPEEGNELPATVSSDDAKVYMMDYATVADATAGPVSTFTLKHLMAQLRVHIKVAENDVHPVPTDAVIDLYTTATVDYPQKALTDPDQSKAVSLGTFGKEEGHEDGDDNWVNAVQLVIPQTLPAGERCIHFTAGGQVFHYTPEREIRLEAGYVTHIYLGVAMNQPDTPLMLEGITVGEWEVAPTINAGEAEEE